MNSSSDSEYELIERMPTVEEYCALRTSVGWRSPAPEAITVGLSHSLYMVCLIHNDQLIGFGRIVGDQALAFYIRDVIVSPLHQGRGFGRKIMNAIMTYLETHAPENAYIGLEAAMGKEDFYRRLGFTTRPSETTGSGMQWRSPKWT